MGSPFYERRKAEFDEEVLLIVPVRAVSGFRQTSDSGFVNRANGMSDSQLDEYAASQRASSLQGLAR